MYFLPTTSQRVTWSMPVSSMQYETAAYASVKRTFCMGLAPFIITWLSSWQQFWVQSSERPTADMFQTDVNITELFQGYYSVRLTSYIRQLSTIKMSGLRSGDSLTLDLFFTVQVSETWLCIEEQTAFHVSQVDRRPDSLIGSCWYHDFSGE